MLSTSERYQRIAELDALSKISAAARATRREDLALVTSYVRASTPTEARLVDICKDILGLDEIGIDDDFFAMNGDSLHCMRVIIRIHEHWNVDLSIETFFEQPTVRQLALAVAAAQRADEGSAPEDPVPVREP